MLNKNAVLAHLRSKKHRWLLWSMDNHAHRYFVSKRWPKGQQLPVHANTMRVLWPHLTVARTAHGLSLADKPYTAVAYTLP